MIYGLNTHWSGTNTLIHRQNLLTCRCREWNGKGKGGCAWSVPVALHSQVDRCESGKSEEDAVFIFKKASADILKINKERMIRKRGASKKGCLQFCSHNSESAINAHCVCLRAAVCQTPEDISIVFNNFRIPLKGRQMGQWWQLCRCHSKPTDRKLKSGKKTNLSSMRVKGSGGRILLPFSQTDRQTQNKVNERSAVNFY